MSRSLIFLLACLGCGVNAAPLQQLIEARLSWMAEVAAYKYQRELPIEDLAREKVVIDRAVQGGLQYALTVESSENFFEAQIAAAKDIQSCWYTRWNNGEPVKQARDLNSVIRPALIDLGDQIVAKLGNDKIDSLGPTDCLSTDSAQILSRAATQVERYASPYKQISDSGYLRIGTTGDYSPFSFKADNDEEYRGIDIDLAKLLAAHLKVKPVFVHTSWPTLSTDFVERRFDIAMSGVSIIEARRNLGLFSIPHHVGGKTPIARCDRKQEFATLQSIDLPDVKVIVNPGGTNERFVRGNLHHARIYTHPDNRTIFQEIIDRRVDVMITDRIEVTLKSAEHPELCSTTAENLSYQEKGFWMVNDPQLKQQVDAWLSQQIESSNLSSIFAKHLGTGD